MEPKIAILERTLLIGMNIQTTAANDKASELWRGFMPRRNEIKNRIGTDFYSIQNYDTKMNFADFTPQTVFEKWATVKVSDLETIPDGMKPFILESGKHAVFTHKGPASTFIETWKMIFFEWLPNSGYELDKRPHFEILTPEYRPDDPNATEDIWIPIK